MSEKIAPQGFLDRYFGLTRKGTTVKTELTAGLLTFLAMSYIIFVGPNIMKAAGIPHEAAVSAVIWTAALCSIAMGLFARLPIGMAPGMGINAFFAFYVCGTLGLPWQTALGCTFISGVVFLLLTITRFRQAIIDAVPMDLKCAIVTGIGLFITFVGLQSSGVIVNSDATLVTLGHVSDPKVALALLGILITGVLMILNVKAALLIGILIIAVLGMFLGVNRVPATVGDFISLELPSFSESFLKLDIGAALDYGLFSIIFTFTVVELFDNIGTTIGVARAGNFMDENGHIENIDRALLTDSMGSILSAVMGTSTVTSYVESSVGANAGGRTGLVAVTVGVLFLLSLVFAPLAGLIPGYATAPALVVVGVLMVRNVTIINFNDLTIGIPAFLTIVMMPLTYSISSGFGFGFISYCALMTLSGKGREIKPLMWVVTALFTISFVLNT